MIKVTPIDNINEFDKFIVANVMEVIYFESFDYDKAKAYYDEILASDVNNKDFTNLDGYSILGGKRLRIHYTEDGKCGNYILFTNSFK